MASIRCEKQGFGIAVACAAAIILAVLLAWSSTPELVERDVVSNSVVSFDEEVSGTASPPTDGVTTYETELELPEASQELVERYRDRGDCLMREAGYLDLLGDAWSCVVQGPDWVDVCVVSSVSGNTGSVVRVQRLERPEDDSWWER